MITPYIRTRRIDGGAIALVRDEGTFRVNVWNEADGTFHDVEHVEHDGTPGSRLNALRAAREFYLGIIDSQVSADDVIACFASA